jgi:phage gpG-like protein
MAASKGKSPEGLIGLTLTGDWELAQKKLAKSPAWVKRALRRSLQAEAEHIAGAMRARFDKLRPPNARNTKLLKGSSKPLVSTGDLRNSISVEKNGDMDFYVGVPRGSRAEKLAAIHERGVTIIQHLTDKQRKFFHAMFGSQGKTGAGGGTGIVVIHIPARPFIRPTFQQESKGAKARFMKHLLEFTEP